MRLQLAPLAILLLSVHHACSSGWTYKDALNWEGECKVGKKQSPVNLQMKRALFSTTDPFVFIRYDELYHYDISNNGHTVQLKLEQPCTIGLTSGDLKGLYELDHIHFHWRSEHLVEGKRRPLEAHFVHYKKEYKNVSGAMNQPNGLAVLGVFFEESEEDNKALNEILPYIGNYSAGAVTPKNHFSPASLLPDPREGFFRYHGSLTTPPCSQSVVWTVFKDTLPISKAQIEQLSHITFNGEEENWRPVQPLYNRKLYLLTYHETYHLSCAGPVKTNPAMCVLLTLAKVLPALPAAVFRNPHLRAKFTF